MTNFPEYPKVYGPYNRYTEGPYKNKLIMGDWTKPEFGELAGLTWIWTEKVDGTNIRVHWDGHKVQFGGRTDNASIPAKLVTVLNETFPEELFEQAFQDKAVTLFGEGYGASIQKGGGNYKSDGVDFVLFDVYIGGWWLLRPNVEEIAKQFGIQTAPIVLEAGVAQAIELVQSGLPSLWSTTDDNRSEFMAEGLVGVTKLGLLGRDGKRLQMKIKTKDFY